jgi:hypothetical protein
MRAVWLAYVLPFERLSLYHEYPIAVSSDQREEEETYMSTLVCVCPKMCQHRHMAKLRDDLHLEILDMTTNRILVRTGITSKDIHQHPRLLQSLSTIVPFHDRDHVGGPLTAVLQPSELEGT